MKIKELQYSDLTWLKVSQDKTCVIFHVVTSENIHYSCKFTNKNHKELIEFSVNWLDMGMIYEEDREYPTFGELENIVNEEGVYTLEGDFGWIDIKANQYKIKKL